MFRVLEDQMGKTRKEIRKDFAVATSCHGMKQIYVTTYKWIQAVWILLIVAVFGLLIWQVRRVKLIVTGVCIEFMDPLFTSEITAQVYNQTCFKVIQEASDVF